jgi:hypothetical protein
MVKIMTPLKQSILVGFRDFSIIKSVIFIKKKIVINKKINKF